MPVRHTAPASAGEGRLGAPAKAWYALWLTPDQYRPAHPDGANALALPLRGVRVLRARPVRATGATDDYARFITMTAAFSALLHDG
ncbi:hypothetical protein [Embleya sp. NPDC001921]